MVASEHHQQSDRPSSVRPSLSAEELHLRIDEEIARAERYGTMLSCLLLVVDNLEELEHEHGGALREETLGYIAGAVPRELRRFDRLGRLSSRELLIVLPGADGPSGEMVARRVLDRLRTIKVEVGGERQTLRVSVGITVWRDESDVEILLQRARATTSRAITEEQGSVAGHPPGVTQRQGPPGRPAGGP
jgi:diguanylate cyclase (GGDEF)-like protein